VGQSEESLHILRNVQTVADTLSTVLITGETGTGKELIANLIHHASGRKLGAFIKVSCAILSREVIESELFGHERGAYTGAEKSRTGRFELSNGGSIYLDDIDDIPLDVQVKLLRVLEERTVERVGGSDSIPVDLRVIASTKADLRKLVEEGKFREDLFYRLNVFPVHVPPLRDRREDLPALIKHFCDMLAPDNTVTFPVEVLESLCLYDWPGNIREVRNVVERLIIFSRYSEISLHHLPPEILRNDGFSRVDTVGARSLPDKMTAMETDLVRRALSEANGHQGKAAKLLGIPQSTLRTKMEKLGLFADSKSDT